MSDKVTKRKRPTLLKNPGTQDVEKIVLQLYVSRLITRQDVLDLSKALLAIVEDYPDKPSYLN
jgi:hypothetical protein